ncbi:Bis-ABC ATPase YheS [Olavius algarvensis associated proteobacterium Delta 3]|nr:Bis-ABC ATPase YheS [Olavius algarvensis associated proteobacterium Delta 3]
MIQLENLTKSFGRQTLFEDIGFQINPRERIGLVGRNGHGKTTLLRLIIGEETPDAGSVIIPKHCRLGYVRQTIAFTESTVLDEGAKELPRSEKDHHWKVEKILAGLGFSPADMARNPHEFSGGYQVRLNLAKVLVSEPDLLMLDEPTNYLDIASIRWVERFLQTWPREVLLVTHDRGFMDAVVTHTLGIHRKKVRKIPGNTEKYYAQIAQEEEIYEKTRLKDERRRKDIERFISRFRAKARLANLVQSRIKTLSKMEKQDRLEQIKDLDFSFRSKPFEGRHVLTARDVSFGYTPGAPVIKRFSLSVGRRERICVVGKNGRGKTTLLRLLAGALAPESGDVTYNPQVAAGFFEQTNIQTLDPSHTVEEEIILAHPDVDRQLARNISGAMMFEGNDALKRISVLSGGEKSRVMLGKLLATPVNVLFLDEPTNHLDLESCDALLAAIDYFDGVVIMVTHNEMFLHALAERLVIFQKGGIQVFDDGYGSFLETIGWEDEPRGPKVSKPEKQAPLTGPPKLSKKALRRMRSELVAERSRILKPIGNEIQETEDAIDSRERELDALNRAMQSATRVGDSTKIADLGQAIHQYQTEIDTLFDKLEVLTTDLDIRKKEFDERLSQIDGDNSE